MKAVLLSSTVLALALLGDALLYAVLPVHAAAFGITLPWVGVLLSANRFVRVFAYGSVARVAASIGMRRACIGAAIASVVATSAYGLGDGPVVLLLARMLWGVAYAAMVLITLGYAVEERGGAGARIGWSRTVQRIGPVVALLAGSWLTAVLGPRYVFVALAAVSALALPFALALPRDRALAGPSPRVPSLGRPTALDVLFFQMGAGVDGVFAVSITLILAQDHSVSVAVLSGGALLALRHLTEAIAAPLFGKVADRYGARRLFVVMMLLTAVGFAGVALGATVPGALLMLSARGSLASLGPAVIVEEAAAGDTVMAPLARLQAWRDLGAAVGPLATGYALLVVSPQSLHGLLALLMAGTLALWAQSRYRRREAVASA